MWTHLVDGNYQFKLSFTDITFKCRPNTSVNKIVRAINERQGGQYLLCADGYVLHKEMTVITEFEYQDPNINTCMQILNNIFG